MKIITTILFVFFLCFFAHSQNPQMVIPFANSHNNITNVVLSNDNKYVATCFQDDLILINEANSGKEIFRVIGIKIAFSPNNNYFVVATSNGEYQLFDFKTGKKLFEPWDTGGDYPITIVFSPKSNQILTNNRNRIIVNTIGESKITQKILKEKRNLNGNIKLQACNFDTAGSTIIVPHHYQNILCFYNSNNLKLEKALNLSSEISQKLNFLFKESIDIYSLLKLDSALYVVGKEHDINSEGGQKKYTFFRKYILDQKRNIISTQTILEGSDWENMRPESDYFLWKIKLINDKIALYKVFKYDNGSANELSIYSLKQDSCLFNLRPKLNSENINDISNDLTFAAVNSGYTAYSKKIIQDTLYYSNTLIDDEKRLILLNFLDNSEIIYVKENIDQDKNLVKNSLVNVSTKSNSAISFDFESSPKTISLQYTDTLKKSYNHYPAPYLYSEKGDSSFIFNENGLLDYKIKGGIICHDFLNNKSVFYSSENEIQVYDIPSNSIIKKIKSPVSIDLTRNYSIDAAISYSNKLLAVSFTFWLKPEDTTRTIYIYNIDSGKLLKELKFDPCNFIDICFDKSGKKLCLNQSFGGGYEIRDIEQDITICKSSAVWDKYKCTFLNDNRVFYTSGFDSRDIYKFTFSKSDTCLGFGDLETNSLWFKFSPSIASVGGIRYSISEPLNSILLSNIDNKIIIINNNISKFNRQSVLDNLEYISMPAFIRSANYIKNSQYILAEDVFGRYYLINSKTNKTLYTFLFLPDNNWLVYDEDYHFDGSQGAMNLLYFTCGLEVIDLAQLKDALYVPGLITKIMNGQTIGGKKLSDLEICGTLPIIEKIEMHDDGCHYKVTPRKAGIKTVELYINGLRVKEYLPSNLKLKDGIYYLDLTKDELQKLFVPGKNNEVKIQATVEMGGKTILSRGYVSVEEDARPVKAPNLYALMIGVNDYREGISHLDFPAKDASDMSALLNESASKLLGKEHVFVYNINSNVTKGNGYATPEKENIQKALKEIGEKAQPQDILFLFFAGHGVMQGETDKKFTLLTSEASKLNLIGISTSDLISWLTPNGPYNMQAQKRILVLDACNSGEAINQLLNSALTARGNNDADDRIKQIENLKDKSGLYILTASSKNQSAFEITQYQHGLLTYCLLKTIKQDQSILAENKYLNIQDWFSHSENELNNIIKSIGKEQNAQQVVASNITIGIIDSEIKNKIVLAAEKPIVICANEMNISGEEDLGLKELINNKLNEIASRGVNSDIVYSVVESEMTNKIDITYTIVNNDINCTAKLKKNRILLKSISVVGKKSELDKLVNDIAQQIIPFAK